MDMRVRTLVGHPMPEMAAFIAELEAAFGKQPIEAAINRGKAGEPTFRATENGRSVGTAGPPPASVWRVDRAVRDRHWCAGCDGSCVGTGRRCRAG
jgi:hypothetical protein